MKLDHPGRGWLVWVGALVLTLGALLLDSGQRLASIREITGQRLSAVPEAVADPGSTSGYAWGQHRVILPAIDGYHWILQTEAMLGGDGGRIRTASYDDAPIGREVHWSGVMRWWSAGLAAGYRARHPSLAPAQALERVVPWANTALLGLLLIALTPVLAWRFGAFGAALFTMGTVAVFPFYEYFVVGYFDHHGVATMGALLTVVFVAAGGAGWVRAESGSFRPRPEEEAVARWLPAPAAARRWFAASAASGAVALWVNAATIVPVLVGVGVGGAVATGWLGRPPGPRSAWRTEPALWRLWGCTGGVLSVAFYLLEYFPGHLGMRLEVNHPLYALAWVGAGDLLARLAAGAVGDPGKRARRDSAWMVVDVLAVALLPVVIVVTGERTFRLADAFLFTLHQRYIIEFLTLGSQLTQMGARLIVGRASALPLLALPLAAALWPTTLAGGVRWAWRALLLIGVGVVLGFTHTVLSALFGGRWPAALAGDALLVATGFGLGRVGGGRALPIPIQAVLALALAPAVLLIGMSVAQVRWVGVGAALWLGVLVVAASALRRETGYPWSRPRKAVAGVLLAVVFVAAPACLLPLPLDRADPPQEVARDASWWLRRRVGGRPAVVFTSPNATTWMAYFGGFPGVGTLYWENLDGLRAATAIYAASTPDALRGLLEQRGVTHLVLFPWDRGLELLRLSSEASGAPAGPEPFLAALVRGLRAPGVATLPAWLTPLPYPAPPTEALGHPAAVMLEIVPDQPRELALVRLAQYYQAVGAPAETEAALRASLEVRPSAPAWALLAQLEAARGGGAEFGRALGGLRSTLAAGEPVAAGDRLNAAVALALGRDGTGAAGQLDLALRDADEVALRALSPDALAILVRLSRQLGLDRTHPDAVATAESLLPRG